MDFSANKDLMISRQDVWKKANGDPIDVVADADQRARTAWALAEARSLLAERQIAFLRLSARPTLVFALLCVSALGLVFWVSGGAA